MNSPLMNAPLGMAAPLGGASAQAASISIPDLPPRRSNVGLIVGVIGVLLIAAVGGGLLTEAVFRRWR